MYVKFTETSEFWLFIITRIYIVTRNAIITIDHPEMPPTPISAEFLLNIWL
jgi:hypothetical protein